MYVRLRAEQTPHVRIVVESGQARLGLTNTEADELILGGVAFALASFTAAAGTMTPCE